MSTTAADTRSGGFWRRVGAMIFKEFLQLRRDRVSFATMITLPVVQLMLFGYAINTTPRNLPTAVLLQEQTDLGREESLRARTPQKCSMTIMSVQLERSRRNATKCVSPAFRQLVAERGRNGVCHAHDARAGASQEGGAPTRRTTREDPHEGGKRAADAAKRAAARSRRAASKEAGSRRRYVTLILGLRGRASLRRALALLHVIATLATERLHGHVQAGGGADLVPPIRRLRLISAELKGTVAVALDVRTPRRDNPNLVHNQPSPGISVHRSEAKVRNHNRHARRSVRARCWSACEVRTWSPSWCSTIPAGS